MKIKVIGLVKGDMIDAGGTRRRAIVESVSEWGTGSVSVQVWSRGRLSQVWFKSVNDLAELVGSN